MEHLRFPVGRFEKPDTLTPEQRTAYIKIITDFPADIESAYNSVAESDRSKPYRPGGWNAHQVVHHCADSHMNAFIRFKLTLTENEPTIRPYQEALWAEQIDVDTDVSPSLDIISGVHSRWGKLLHGMTDKDFAQVYHHPEHPEPFTLDQALANYEWHCRHHIAHILLLK